MTLHNEQPEGFRLPFDLSPEVEELLRRRAWEQIVRGDLDVDGFIELIADELPERLDLDADEAEAIVGQGEEIFDAALTARRAQQAQWSDAETATTLTRAFEALAEIGVVARENFTCCGTCGSTEIWDEVDDSRTWRGYVFYHMQDTDSLIETGETYIGYGAFPTTKKPLFQSKARHYESTVVDLMTNEVIPLLERHGVTVEWDGQLSRRILLKNVDYYAKV
ncbi:MAG: hypothetical protein QM621_00635 [Aeromicrobium sp.]|uniref:DUF6891 domain-containing protein n=1 Tax=Aeromicrobium sp. TaxID=1871063 RepID=UPI0039E3691B